MSLGLALCSAVSQAQSQPDYWINTFSTSSEASQWSRWWGGAPQTYTWEPGVDAGGGPGAGSLEITAGFDLAAHGVDNQLAALRDFDAGAVVDGRSYAKLAFSIRWDPGSPKRNTGDFGYLEYGLRHPDWSQTWLGGLAVPVTASESWLAVLAPIDPSIPKVSAVSGVVLKLWSGSPGGLTGTTTFWVDNVRLMSWTASPASTPVLLAIDRATPGLRMTASQPSDPWQRQGVRTLATGPDTTANHYSWLGSAGPVSYSMTIREFPDALHSAFQAHMFLVPESALQSGAAEPAVDWSASDIVFFQVSNLQDGTAAGRFMFKTNQPNGNAMLWNSNPESGPVGTLATVSAPSAVGEWIVTFNNNTNVTVAAPGGATSQFTMPAAAVARFAEPIYAYFGIQPSAPGNLGRSATFSRLRITGSRTTLDDTFAGDALDPARWQVVAAEPRGVLQIPPSAFVRVHWLLPGDASIGSTYNIEFAEQPGSTSWLTNSTLTAATRSVEYFDTAGTPVRPSGYYRVVDTASGLYSTNTVGYVSIPVQVGENQVSNPLRGSSDRLADLIPSPPAGTMVRRHNPATGTDDIALYDPELWFGWDNPDIPLAPGESFVLLSPEAFVLSFLGEVLAGPPTAPGITRQPQSQTVAAGASVTMRVEASGTQPLTYQWRFNGIDVAGAHAPDLIIASSKATNAGGYSVVITNHAGSVTSQVAVLTVLLPPTITAEPQDQHPALDTTATFTVSATGTEPITYQWQFNDADIAGANGPTLTISGVQPANTGRYAVVVSNAAGYDRSRDAILKIAGAPEITSDPAAQSVFAGATAEFQVTVTGLPPLRYQWRKDGLPLVNGGRTSGADTAVLRLADVQPVDAGGYDVVVTNSVGSVTSSRASLEVTEPPQVLVEFATRNPDTNNGRVFKVDGTTPLGSEFKGQLYAGTNAVQGALTAIGSPVSFTGGYILGRPVSVPWAVPGQQIHLQLRVWSQAQGGSFESAVAAGGGWGKSDIFPIVPTAPPMVPPLANTFPSFSLAYEYGMVNIRPSLDRVQDLTVDEATLVALTITASDADVPQQALTYSLVSGPSGISLDTTTGRFAWTPSETQGPSTNVITVRVTDNGTPPLSDTMSFNVVVLEVNSPPVVTPIPDQSVLEANLLSFSVVATDGDLPDNTLAFSLDSAPEGARVDPVSGHFTWTPTEAQGPSTNLVTVRVTDNGNPPLSTTRIVNIVVNEPPAPTQGTLRWAYATGGMVKGSPAIGTDGTVYFGSSDAMVYALDGRTGQRKWRFQTGGKVQSSPAIGSDGTVFVGSEDRNLYALSGSTGQKKWAFLAGAMIRTSPAVASDGSVYVASYDGKVYALEGATGQLKWSFDTGEYVWANSSPAVGDDGTVYIGSDNGIVYALDAASGQQKWAFTTTPGYYVYSSPAIGVDGTIYVGSWDKNLYAIDGATGQERWRFSTGGEIVSSPAIGLDGTVFVGSNDHFLYAVDGATGQKKWQSGTGSAVESSPTVGTDGAVYVGSFDSNIYALEASTGAERWHFATTYSVGSSPAIGADGTLYVGSADGGLYAVFTGSVGGSAETPWPTFRHDTRHTGRVGPAVPMLPIISLQPQDQAMITGTSVGFRVGATGTPPLTYQWRKDGVNLTDGGRISGATTATLNLSHLELSDEGLYDVVVSNSEGAVTSVQVHLVVRRGGLIANVVESGGDNEATDTLTAKWSGITFSNGVPGEFLEPFTVRPFGEDVPAYVDRTHQWNGASISLPLPSYLMDGEYIMIGNDNRDNPVFRLDITVTGPALVYVLLDNRLGDGNSADPPHNGLAIGDWQSMGWMRSEGFAPMKNGHNRSVNPEWPDELGIDEYGDGAGPGVSINNCASVYFKRVLAGTFPLYQMGEGNRNMYGVVVKPDTSPPAPPTITQDPLSQSVYAGTSVHLGVTAWGTEPLGYQWRKDGVNLTDGGRISGATTATLNLVNAEAGDAGAYDVVVSNAAGSATSQTAALTIKPNTSPVLGAIADQTVQANNTLTLAITATDADAPANTLTFSLVSAPPGASIDPATGVFSWTPTEAQAPSTNIIAVMVIDNGAPPLSATTSFRVFVTTKPAVVPGTKLWQFATGGTVLSSPAYGLNGTVYFGCWCTAFYAVDGATGAKRWEFTAGSLVQSSPAIGSDGTVYVGCDEGKVYALNGETGAKRWEFATGSLVQSGPAVGIDGTVYVGSFDGKVYALNGATGTKRWQFATGASVHSSPALGPDGTVYVASNDGKVYALDGMNGTLVWQFMRDQRGYWEDASPAIGADGTVYIGSPGGMFYALDGVTGARRWEFTTGGRIPSSAAIGPDGVVYFGSDDGRVYAVEGATGVKLWDRSMNHSGWSSPALGADGVLYIGSRSGMFSALDSRNGQILWEFAGAGGDGSPVIAPGGTVYVGSGSGLYAFATSSSGGAANSPWPMFHQNALHTGLVAAGSTTPPIILQVPRISLGESCTLRWNAEPGVTYRLSFKENLADPEWTLLSQLTFPGAMGEFTDRGLRTARYYRVQAIR